MKEHLLIPRSTQYKKYILISMVDQYGTFVPKISNENQIESSLLSIRSLIVRIGVMKKLRNSNGLW